VERVRKSLASIRPRRFPLAFAAGAIVVIVVWFEIATTWSDSGAVESPRYLIAKRRLLKGNPISFSDLTTRIEDEGVAANVAADRLTDQDLPLLKGAFLKKTLVAGEPVTLSQLELSPAVAGLGGSVPKGLRAYAIRPSPTLNLRRGDRIDVLLSSTPEEPVATLLLEDVAVLDVGQREEEFEVIVAVSGWEIQILEKAQQKGKLNIALRNPHETASTGESPGRRLLAPRAKKKGVEIISEMEGR